MIFRTPLALAIAALLPAVPMAAQAQAPDQPPPQGAEPGYAPNQGAGPQGYGPGQDGNPRHGYGRGGGGPMTLAQFQARSRDRIMRADADHDGRVSLAEWTAAMSQRHGGRGGGMGDPQQMFERMDLNHDGFITPDEIDAVSARRFERMDANHDGVVTPDERGAMRGGRDGGDEPAQPLPQPQ